MPPEDPFDTPQKKYVRTYWLKASEKRKEMNGVEFINYCTFPGRNCHDVILLDPLLKKNKTGYLPETLTFFEKDIEVITDIRNNLPGARYYCGYFEEFVQATVDNRQITPDQESEGVNPLKYFPYDVINLDYTGPGFKHEGKKTSNEMRAIYQVFEIQGFKHKSFTLFLTFPAVKRWDDSTGREELNKSIIDSLSNPDNVSFKSKFYELYPKVTPPYYSNETKRHKALGYRDFLLISIPIVIINFGFRNNFDVKCRKRFYYIGEGNETLMVSFIFDCDYLASDAYNGTPDTKIKRLRPIRLREIFNQKTDVNKSLETHSV